MKLMEKKGLSAEIHELVRARAELQCTVADLERATEMSGERRGEIEKELKAIEKKIKATEKELAKSETKWTESKEKESAEKKRCVYSFPDCTQLKFASVETPQKLA